MTPVSDRASAFVPRTFPSHGDNGAPCICVLDDDVSVLNAVERLLRSEGLKVAKFNEPAAFLDHVAEAGCEVLILDVSMPRMSGLEVQARLREQSPDTRVIFITGGENPAERETALKAGAVDFLAKPFDDETLLQLVRHASTANRRACP